MTPDAPLSVLAERLNEMLHRDHVVFEYTELRTLLREAASALRSAATEIERLTLHHEDECEHCAAQRVTIDRLTQERDKWLYDSAEEAFDASLLRSRLAGAERRSGDLAEALRKLHGPCVSSNCEICFTLLSRSALGDAQKADK